MTQRATADVVRFLRKRIKIVEKAARESAAKPNPWAHRAAELRLVLEHIVGETISERDDGALNDTRNPNVLRQQRGW